MEKINTKEFQETVYKFVDEEKQEFQGELPCIVDFYADWCQPCKLMTPALEKISEEYAGKLKVFKVNIEEEHALTERYKIKTIPTLMFCPVNGEPQVSNGVLPKVAIQKIIEDVLL